MFSLLVISLFLVGCTKSYTTDQGKVTVTNPGTGKDWCKKGAEWKFTGDTAKQGSAQWKIEGLMTSGEYNGLCHVLYKASNTKGNAKIDYYFSKDGKSGYLEMDVNGKKMKQQWTG